MESKTARSGGSKRLLELDLDLAGVLRPLLTSKSIARSPYRGPNPPLTRQIPPEIAWGPPEKGTCTESRPKRMPE